MTAFSMRAAEVARFSHQLELIYEAALSPSKWPAVVETIVEDLNCRGGLLFTPFHPVGSTGFVFPAKLEQAQLEEYAAQWQERDVWALASAEKGYVVTGKVYAGEEVLPRKQLLASPMYRQFMRRWDISRTCISIVFGAESKDIPPTVLSSLRGVRSPAFEPKTKRWLALLLPHISRAIGVMCRLRTAELQVAASRVALDRIACGVVLLSPSGAVLFANKVATRIINEGDALKLRRTAHGDCLLAGNQTEAYELNAAISSALDAGAVEVAHFSRVVRLSRRTGALPVALSVSTLPAANEFSGANEEVRAIAFITDTAEPTRINHALVKKLYKLSPAELRLVGELCGGESLPEIAARLKVSDTTLRTQLQSVFLKTQTRRQTQLVKLVLSLSSTST